MEIGRRGQGVAANSLTAAMLNSLPERNAFASSVKSKGVRRPLENIELSLERAA
jgi:hypothetical protein